MGTWSTEPFGNDSACDWVHDLVERGDFSLVEDALRRVIETGDDYLDEDLAVEAVAAAEVLAKSRGRGTQTDAYTARVDAWLAGSSAKPDEGLFPLAHAALVRIQAPDSELAELWEESDDAGEWQDAMRRLQAALSTPD